MFQGSRREKVTIVGMWVGFYRHFLSSLLSLELLWRRERPHQSSAPMEIQNMTFNETPNLIWCLILCWVLPNSYIGAMKDGSVTDVKVFTKSLITGISLGFCPLNLWFLWNFTCHRKFLNRSVVPSRLCLLYIYFFFQKKFLRFYHGYMILWFLLSRLWLWCFVSYIYWIFYAIPMLDLPLSLTCCAQYRTKHTFAVKESGKPLLGCFWNLLQHTWWNAGHCVEWPWLS